MDFPPKWSRCSVIRESDHMSSVERLILTLETRRSLSEVLGIDTLSVQLILLSEDRLIETAQDSLSWTRR